MISMILYEQGYSEYFAICYLQISYRCKFKLTFTYNFKADKATDHQLLCVSFTLFQMNSLNSLNHMQQVNVKVGVLYPVQQPGSYWDRSSGHLLESNPHRGDSP